MEGDCKEQNLVQVEVHDVEEGEISDSASVEEISEEAFTKQTPPPPSPHSLQKTSVNFDKVNAKNNGLSSSGNGGRFWAMSDMHKYRISSTTSYSGLYNLAWSQAVNNKPLDEVFVMMEDNKSTDKKNYGNNCVSEVKDLTGNEESKVVIVEEDDEEKEEGELEEGEIDLDSDVVIKNEGLDGETTDENNEFLERGKRVDVIKKELQSLNLVGKEKSFDRLCSSLKDLADRLAKLVLDISSTEKETLVQLLCSAMQIANSVYSSMNLRLKDLNREVLTRLLKHMINSRTPLFSSLQLKEMEAIISSLGSSVKSLGKDGDSKTKQVVVSFSKNDSFIGLVNSKHKGVVLPLLDLHKEHDADSLPSPTQELSAPLPFDKGSVFGHGSFRPEWPIPRRTIGNSSMHPYESDAVQVVSSYQQKFGRSSSYMKDELPSPTPSGEADTGDHEMSGEVSSSINHNVTSDVHTSSLDQPIASLVNSSILRQPAVLYTSVMNAIAGKGISKSGIVNPASNNANPVPRSSLARSRDPRLRLTHSDGGARNLNQGLPAVETNEPTINTRKKKKVEELVFYGPMLKRQRKDSTEDVQAAAGNGGWLEDMETVGIPEKKGNSIMGSFSNVSRSLEHSVIPSSITTHGNDKSQFLGHNTPLPISIPTTTLSLSSATSTSLMSSQATAMSSSNLPVKNLNATTSLHSLLRDVAVNPSILMNILKAEYQRSSEPNLNPTNRVPSGSSVLGRVSEGATQVPSRSVSVQEEYGKVQMKPRDPRRILQNNAAKIGGTSAPDQPKLNAIFSSAMSSNLGTPRHNNWVEKLGTSSTTKPPDITKEFTTKLRNIADILSVTQASTSSPIIPQIPSSQQALVHQGGLNPKGVVPESGNLKKGTGLVPEQVNAGPPRPLKANAWSDVEHLFDGFDDQQKAAIQKERDRRLEEQKKLFAVRKLCLVLDLDHTLLNSAKFVEVDPMHDELLRKKEEQDREKPFRHLFRFPHMSMWTKLRPGIWNFLEKASKLYELHLYTMGNKYYATEMAKLLDPKGELFSGRVISRGDDGEPLDRDDSIPKTKDLDGILGMESSVVIIDDSVRVWPHHKLNLIAVERYIYFPCSRRQFGLPGPSLLEIDHDERPEDGTLASSLAVIERIHENFFAHESLDVVDVRDILASEQRKILCGCRIVFSRIFPVGEANPQMHPLWQTAEQFGAVCSNQMDDQVTHVVANSLGTDKVNWAHSNGRFVVHPGWVEASALLYRRANEHDFAIKQ